NADEKETKNVAKAVEYIHKSADKELSLRLIKKLHKLCFQGTKSFAGKLRAIEVVIKDSEKRIIHVGVPAGEVEIYLKEMINWYEKNKNKFKPLILAGIIHNQFENIHPFRDGNGRIGRLLLNFILLKNNYPPINLLLEDRGEYYYVLQEYSNHDEITSTIKFLVKQYQKTLKQVTTKNHK
ncbi:MAG: Fic family protein, partial [Phycisphaerae bacterium]|nr:Fic family protein [Phycisphaerae bacterium]